TRRPATWPSAASPAAWPCPGWRRPRASSSSARPPPPTSPRTGTSPSPGRRSRTDDGEYRRQRGCWRLRDLILRSPRTRCVPYPARQRRRALLMNQFVQILGAVLVLIAYIAGQLRLLDGKSYPYLALNLLGSGLLAVLAAAGSQWGFLLLEGTWALVSLLSLGARLFSAGST